MVLSETGRVLLEKNLLVLRGEVNDKMVEYVIECIEILKAKDSPEIIVEITSGGGNVSAGLSIFDILRLYPGQKTGKVIICAHSMAAIILQACDKRLCAKHAKVLIHHISQSSVSLDILRSKKRIQETLEDMEKNQRFIYDVLCKRTGQSMAMIKKTCAEEIYMSASEAVKFGLVDKII
jgi:ATP-dependent Clp protease, protease subunit